jgi:hypothetical protein
MPHEDKAADIQCELFEYSLPNSCERTHMYDSLSYVWGNPAEKLPIFIHKPSWLAGLLTTLGNLFLTKNSDNRLNDTKRGNTLVGLCNNITLSAITPSTTASPKPEVAQTSPIAPRYVERRNELLQIVVFSLLKYLNNNPLHLSDLMGWMMCVFCVSVYGPALREGQRCGPGSTKLRH